MQTNLVGSLAFLAVASTTVAWSEDCSMVGGCENTVGYIALKKKDGKPTYRKRKAIEVGDTITLDAYLHLRAWPKIDQGNRLRHGSKVKILEFYQGEKELAVVHVISVPK